MKKVIRALWCTFGITVLIFICSVIFLKSDAALWRMFSIVMPIAGVTFWGAILLTVLQYVRAKKEK